MSDNAPVYRGPVYVVRNGRLCKEKRVKRNGDYVVTYVPLADFYCEITSVETRVNGEDVYVISGVGVRGGPFKCRISAYDFTSDRKLAKVLSVAVGALDPVFVGGASHLGPAIKLLSSVDGMSDKRTRVSV